jgi:N-methylhydantoinase A
MTVSQAFGDWTSNLSLIAIGISEVRHGNAIVEGKGAKVGLITTAGFEDVLEIRRVARPKEAAFDFGADNPPPLVPRYLRRGILERIDKDVNKLAGEFMLFETVRKTLDMV